MDRLIVGWNKICEFLGGCSTTTAKNMKRNYGLPVRHLPTHKPFLVESEALDFVIRYDEENKKEGHGKHCEKLIERLKGVTTIKKQG